MTFTQAVEIIRERAAADIVSIVGETVKLKGTRGQFQGLCPFHDEKSPSFQVSESKQIFKCFGCGEGGDAIEFVMKSRGLDFPEAIRHLARRYNLSIDDKSDDRYRQKLSAEEEILPGITELRGEIRKAGKVYLAIAPDIYQTYDVSPKILVDSPITTNVAEILKKYANKVLFLPGFARWIHLKASLQAIIPTSIQIYFYTDNGIEKKETDWLHYLAPEVGGLVQRQEVSRLIALLPEELDRSIYTTEFAKLLSENSKTPGA